MRNNAYVFGGLALIVLFFVGAAGYYYIELPLVAVPKSTFGAVDLNAYEVMRHRKEHPGQFAELNRTGRIFAIPAGTECKVIETNWVLADEPLHVSFRTGARSGTQAFLWARDVQHHVEVP